MLTDTISRWKRDPVSFMESLLDPETGERYQLYEDEKTFVREAFTLTPAGTLPYPELLFSGPKKSGKTALAALCTLYVVLVLGGRFAEGYCVANDLEQAQGRVYQALTKVLEANSIFASSYTATGSKVTFHSTGATITALAADYRGASGANPTITVFDELWGYVSENARRLWDECVPPPTRRVACRLTVSYAGFEGESEVLEDLYKKGIAGRVVARDLYATGPLLMYWTHDLRAPWQSEAWRAQMETQLRRNAYLRLIENRWVTTESSFVPMEWWDACVNTALRPVVADKGLVVWLGVDASVKRDSTAVVACTWNSKAKKVRLVWHRIIQPKPSEPLDFEEVLEELLLDLFDRFNIGEARYDPYQMIAVAQRLTKRGLPMVEFPQTVPNLTEASSNLYELIKGSNLEAYEDAEIRLAVSRAVAVETTRGWRIAKEKTSHKIDVVVALAQAALGAVKGYSETARASDLFYTGPVSDEDEKAIQEQIEARLSDDGADEGEPFDKGFRDIVDRLSGRRMPR